jgi:hypothetical protein
MVVLGDDPLDLIDGGDVLPSPSFLLIWVTMASEEEKRNKSQ